MPVPQPESQPCYSARLLRPFGRLLQAQAGVPEAVSDSVLALDPDDRIPIATTHELLQGAIELTGDENVGLRAALTIEAGDFSALEYAAGTARTSLEALETIARYMKLINDALTLRIEVEGDDAVVILDSALVLPRAAEAYEVGAVFIAARHRAPELVGTTRLAVEFTHTAPEELEPYYQVFGDHANLRFDQPRCAFVFPAWLLQAPVAAADPHLHALIRKHADLLLEELPRAESFTSRVRERIADGLASGKASIAHVASDLHVSQRTLARRLTEEGTSFKELTEQVRRNLAERYVGKTDLTFSEIAFLLGFSQSSAFHRAFKRWTDATPREYRSRHRG